MPGSSSLRPTILYQAISWILFPAALAYTLVVAIKNRNCQYLAQRLGIYNFPAQNNNPIWCHCASVGEINTALPLLNRLLEEGEQLVVSTNTTTGHEILIQSNLKHTNAVLAPLDYAYFSHNFTKKFSPKLLLLVETELWPNLCLTSISQKIPVIIVNGRITEKTLNAPAILKQNYSRILNNVEHIYASNQSNAERFISLGANNKRLSTLDNL
ncbi:MAG: glycosyltransferase N-terminal domain-containing protein, partial [Pseudomonadota bacterium]